MSLADRLLTYGSRTRVTAGSALFRAGDPSGAVYAVLVGRLRIEVSTPSGGRLVLAVKEPGDLVGELGALDGRPRSAGAVAVDDVELAQVSVEGFLHAIEREPGLAIALLRRMSAELRSSVDRATARNSADTTTRLARLLVELKDRFGEHNGATVDIDLTLTQEDLAGWIGATREATARSLRALREAGCVETGRRRISVVDAAALEVLAEDGRQRR